MQIPRQEQPTSVVREQRAHQISTNFHEVVNLPERPLRTCPQISIEVDGKPQLLVEDSGSSITTFPKHLWWREMPKRSAWSLRSSTGDTGPLYGPVSVKFNLNGRKVDFPAMITEGPECLLGADFLGTYKGLLSMQHSAIQFTLPDGTRTVVDCDGSAPCPDARRLVKVIRATETIRVEERAEVTVSVDDCAGRGPNWRY